MEFIDLKSQQNKIKDKIDQRIKKVLDHGQYIMGPEIDELEEKLSNYIGIKHCISCSSGTDALLIPLVAMGIGPGDAIITTPFTYIATVEVIALLGATPVFCDIYDRTFNINPSGLEEAYNDALSKNLKPKAIIPVDLFGLPARYRLIEEFAKDKNLLVLEDAAQGFGGKIGDKSVSALIPFSEPIMPSISATLSGAVLGSFLLAQALAKTAGPRNPLAYGTASELECNRGALS